MRRLTPALFLIVAACATAPREAPLPQVTPVAPSPHVHSGLIGLTAAEVIARVGNPALQVREGVGLKMQFRSRYCVLDTYLYPPTTGGGLTRVSHVDARLASGADTDQAGCISTFATGR